MSFDIHSRLFGIDYLELCRVKALVQYGTTAKAARRSCTANVLEHYFEADQRFSCPIGSDQIKHAVFNQVPFRRTRRKMAYGDGQTKLIRQLLQTHAPGPATRVVASTAITFDRQASCPRVFPTTDRHPPRPQRLYCKGRGFVGNTNDHVSRVASDIVNAKRDRATVRPTRKVVIEHIVVVAAPGTSGVLEIANQLLFLCIDTDDGPTPALKTASPTPQETKLPVAFRIVGSRQTFSVGSQRIILLLQQAGDGRAADGDAAPAQLRGQFTRRLVRPAQAAHRVAGRGILEQLTQFLMDVRVFFRPPCVRHRQHGYDRRHEALPVRSRAVRAEWFPGLAR